MDPNDPVRQKITDLIASDRVVLFMKGTRRGPQCGFSAQVVAALDELLPTYTTVDVLADPALRDGIKAFTSWPTIPQLYVGGQFVGGCDIVRDLRASGELPRVLGVAGAAAPTAAAAATFKPPAVTLTDAAREAFRAALADAGDFVRLEVDARYAHDLSVGPREAGDVEVAANGLVILMARDSAARADGVTIDYVEGPGGAGFKIDNPGAPASVRVLTATELKAWRDAGRAFELFDVRTDAERAIARIDGARHLDDAARAAALELDRATTMVFHCHHGMRSRAAAEYFVSQGFRNVYNLTGGIDAWSRQVDSKVPLY
jgi:monothiol glutaredoxin